MEQGLKAVSRASISFLFIAGLLGSAAAQERVTIGTMRTVANSALFLTAVRGYFEAEGLTVDMTAYASDQDVVNALAAGATDFGLAGFTVDAFNLAGRGTIKAVAAQVREQRSYEGYGIIASNAAYNRGVRKIDNLANSVIATGPQGSMIHYQLDQIIRVKGFNAAGIAMRPQASIEAIATAIRSGSVDAGILPGDYARDMMSLNDGKLIGWYSDVDEQQLGALFASAKMIATRRETAIKFVRAYRRGVADYAVAFMRHDSSGKRMLNKKSAEVAAAIARYIYPGRATDQASMAVEGDAWFMDPKARLDIVDIKRQIEWYQAKGLVDKKIDARTVVDASFR